MGQLANASKTVGSGLAKAGAGFGKGAASRGFAAGALRGAEKILGNNSTQNLGLGSKACPIARECRDVIDGISQGDFTKVALNTSVLALGAVPGGGSTAKLGASTSAGKQVLQAAALSTARPVAKQAQPEVLTVQAMRTAEGEEISSPPTCCEKSFFRSGGSNIPHWQKKLFDEYTWVNSEDLLVVADGAEEQAVIDLKLRQTSHPDQDLEQALAEATKPFVASSAMAMAKFDAHRPNVLTTAYSGNSGYLLLRPKANEDGTTSLETVFRSQKQKRAFDFLFQWHPEREAPEPLSPVHTEHEVQNNDIIVMFSDVVADLLQDSDMVEQVEAHTKGQELADAGGCSACLAELASDGGDFTAQQGKENNITVVCAQLHTKGSARPHPEIRPGHGL